MQGSKLPFVILVCCSLFLFPVGCGVDSGRNSTGQWDEFLVGTWRLVSITYQGLMVVTVVCPGKIEIGEGVTVLCGEQDLVLVVDGSFRTDLFQDERYFRMEGTWRFAEGILVLETTEAGESETGSVEDELMQPLESPMTNSFALQRTGDSLQMTEIEMTKLETVVPVTALYEREA